jgi:endonuclease YncB( thermonuclease family)
MDSADRLGKPVGPLVRARHDGLAIGLLLVMAVAVVAGGRLVDRRGPQLAVEPIAAEDMPPADDPDIGNPKDPASEPGSVPSADHAARSPSRTIDPERAGPPAAWEKPLERVAPRAPLSELSLAVPPRPKAPADLAGKPLFHPIAEAAGVIEAKGQSLTVFGIEVVKPDETCSDSAGKSWPCGARARTTFRGFLRGRAVVCAAPEKTGGGKDAAQCKVGRQDIGEWLVENGWARAAKGGPYEKAGRNAREAKKGIFGAAPDLTDLPPESSVTVAPLPKEDDEPSSILDLSGTAAMPPSGPATTPPSGFPPAPAL